MHRNETFDYFRQKRTSNDEINETIRSQQLYSLPDSSILHNVVKNTKATKTNMWLVNKWKYEYWLQHISFFTDVNPKGFHHSKKVLKIFVISL